VKGGKGRPRKGDRDVKPRARAARLRRSLEKLPPGDVSAEDFHTLMVDWAWLKSPSLMGEISRELEKGVREIGDEILKRAGETQKRLDEIPRQEIEKMKDFVRNKMG
jgi:hypothetical protein